MVAEGGPNRLAKAPGCRYWWNIGELLSVTSEMNRASAELSRGLSTNSPDTDVEADTAPSALAFAGTRGVTPIATIDGDPVAFDADITSSPRTTSSPRKRSPFATTHLQR